jgi:hypothetical protein
MSDIQEQLTNVYRRAIAKADKACIKQEKRADERYDAALAKAAEKHRERIAAIKATHSAAIKQTTAAHTSAVLTALAGAPPAVVAELLPGLTKPVRDALAEPTVTVTEDER